MLIDVHAHLNPDRQPDGGKKRILEICEFYKVDKVLISTLNSPKYNPTQELIGRCNEMTAGFMKERPGLIEGLAYINPSHTDCVDVMRRCIEDHGMRGVKIHAATFCDDVRVNPIAEQAIKYGLPILCHTFSKSMGQLDHESRGPQAENIGRRYPELKFIAAHIGANVYAMVKCIKDVPNVCVDFSGSIFRRDDVEYTVKHLGADRVLFGSDMPGVFENCLGKAESAGLSDRDREKIYYKNAVRLFKLDAEGYKHDI